MGLGVYSALPQRPRLFSYGDRRRLPKGGDQQAGRGAYLATRAFCRDAHSRRRI